MNKLLFRAGCAALLSLGVCFAAQASTIYPGNGGTSFGGPLGTGSLALSDDGTTIFGTFNRGGGDHNDYLVIYIDSQAGGFSTTGGFNDQGDDHRRAISGIGWDGRSTVNFASGFEANYAIAIHNNFFTFGGLWELAEGGDGSLGFIRSVDLSGGGNAQPSYTFEFDLADIGISPGDAFNFVATYTAPSGFRSNEAIGASDAPGGGDHIGLGTLNYTGFETYVTIPEPATMALLALAGLAGCGIIRRRR